MLRLNSKPSCPACLSLLMLVVGLLTVPVLPGYSCSTIVLKKDGTIMLAKNFDWTLSDGMLLCNPRAARKTAYFTHPGQRASWISKYGSLTFNQNGRGMPYGGMNEKGLVVEMLWLDATRYNLDSAKPYLNELEFIQYRLDNFETVQQVIDHLDALKIYPIKGKLHYVIADATGASVIIEYLDGKATVHARDSQTCQAITNNGVDYSARYKDQFKGKNNTSSLYRYHRLDQEILELKKADLQEQTAFTILDEVRIRSGDFRTMWSIVYDISQRKVSFRTSSHRKIKSVSIADLNFDQAPAYVELHQDKKLTLADAFRPLEPTVNLALVQKSLTHLGFEDDLTAELSQHQLSQRETTNSIFARQYFHMEITVPLNAEQQQGFLAVMDSEANFNRQRAVPGGYLYSNVGKGKLVTQICGLRNGNYALLAFIDENKNRMLDFAKTGKALEKYATFGPRPLANAQELTFANTSRAFDQSDSKFIVSWIGD